MLVRNLIGHFFVWLKATQLVAACYDDPSVANNCKEKCIKGFQKVLKMKLQSLLFFTAVNRYFEVTVTGLISAKSFNVVQWV